MKIYVFLYFVLIIILVESSLSVQKRKQYEIYYSKALAALELQDFKDCELHIIEALKYEPNDIEANQLLGSLYLKSGNYSEGVDFLKRAVEQSNSEYPRILANYIEGLRLSNRLLEARSVSKFAVLKHPVFVSILFHSALVEDDIGDYEKAYQLYLKTLEINQNHLASWEKAGSLLIGIGRFSEAKALLEQANLLIRENPNLQYLAGHF